MISIRRAVPLAALASGLLAGCATIQTAPETKSEPTTSTAVSQMPAPVAAAPAANGPTARNGAPTAAPAAAIAPPPGSPRPFDEIVKGAKRIDGYFPLWQKDESRSNL